MIDGRIPNDPGRCGQSFVVVRTEFVFDVRLEVGVGRTGRTAVAKVEHIGTGFQVWSDPNHDAGSENLDSPCAFRHRHLRYVIEFKVSFLGLPCPWSEC